MGVAIGPGASTFTRIFLPLTCLVSYEVSRPLVPYAYRPGRTPTSKLKLCFRVGYPGGEVQPIPEGDSSPIPERTHWGGLAMHRRASILCLFLAANLIAAGQGASPKAAVGQSARTA